MAASDEVRIVLKFYDMATSAANQVLRRRSISPASSAPPSAPSSAPPSAPNTPAASGRTGSSSRANSSHRDNPARSPVPTPMTGGSTTPPRTRLTSSAAATAAGATGTTGTVGVPGQKEFPSSSSRRSSRSTDTATGGASASVHWASPGKLTDGKSGSGTRVKGNSNGSSTAEESGLLQQRMLALEEQVTAQEHWKLRAAAQMERMEAQIAALQKQQQSLNNSASGQEAVSSAERSFRQTRSLVLMLVVYSACSVAGLAGLF